MKTPEKMTTYLTRMNSLGLRTISLIVPERDVKTLQEAALEARLAYLSEIVESAPDDDERLDELAKGNLARAVSPKNVAHLRDRLDPSHHAVFTKHLWTMQQAWSNLVVADNEKNTATATGAHDVARRMGAAAAVAAARYKQKRDKLLDFVERTAEN